MLILGIDPGLARTGWGIVKKTNQTVTPVDYGCFTTKTGTKEEKRLLILYEKLIKLFKRYKPDALALEKIFFATNAKTAFMIGQARGVILLAAGTEKLAVSSYTPLQIKLAVTGYGKAEKMQIQKMIKSILKLPKIPKPDDAADALAVALTDCFTHKYD